MKLFLVFSELAGVRTFLLLGAAEYDDYFGVKTPLLARRCTLGFLDKGSFRKERKLDNVDEPRVPCRKSTNISWMECRFEEKKT